MARASTSVLLINMVISLLLTACAPPTPKVDPPRVSQAIERALPFAANGADGVLLAYCFNERRAS